MGGEGGLGADLARTLGVFHCGAVQGGVEDKTKGPPKQHFEHLEQFEHSE